MTIIPQGFHESLALMTVILATEGGAKRREPKAVYIEGQCSKHSGDHREPWLDQSRSSAKGVAVGGRVGQVKDGLRPESVVEGIWTGFDRSQLCWGFLFRNQNYPPVLSVVARHRLSFLRTMCLGSRRCLGELYSWQALDYDA